MKNLNNVKGKMCLLLVTAILILCIGFIMVGCGTGPATKAVNNNVANGALDFTDCPSGTCTVVFSTDIGTDFEGKSLTFEAWVQPKATSTGVILQRKSSSRGAALTYSGATSTTVTPKFKIIRAITSISPTSTATYEVTAASTIALNAWSHITGILTDQDHSAVAGHPACAGVGANADATDDATHLDIYIGSVGVAPTISACSYTWGGNTASAVLDPTLPAAAYADEPLAHTAGPGNFGGIIDEARIWNVTRTATELAACDGVELSIGGGDCDIDSSNLITYHRFNAGSGYSVYDASGKLGVGTKEYPDPNNAGEFLHWTTGWTTDTPF